MRFKKRSIYNVIVSLIVVACMIISSFPVNAASKMSGLDFTMTKGDDFEVDCRTPVGMKTKKINITRCKKNKLTPGYLLDTYKESEILEYYDDFYERYVFEEYEEEALDYSVHGDTRGEKKAINRYYKKILSKLELVKVRIYYSRRWNPTISDVDGSCNTSNFYGHTIHITDYNSGKSFITNKCKQTPIAKSKGVYVVDIDWYDGDSTYFYNYYGEYIYLKNYGYADVYIIKPKKYKNLCIGVAGDSKNRLTSMDKKYYKGKISFKSTSWYVEHPDNSKWMRIK